MVKLNMVERKNIMDSYSLHKEEQNVFCLVPHLPSSESFQVEIIKENLLLILTCTYSLSLSPAVSLFNRDIRRLNHKYFSLEKILIIE